MSLPRPLVVIVGPTASGKTALAIELAEKYGGEIICADSRTVYRGLDVGTAKPSAEERERVPHHLLDVVDPDEPFSVADFKRLAIAAIEDILGRGKLPLLVGGSGLYIDSVLFDYSFSDGHLRDEVNDRHAHQDSSHTKAGMRQNTLVIGLEVAGGVLKARIRRRVEVMINDGFLAEAQELLLRYPQAKALDAPGYKAARLHLEDQMTLEEMREVFVRNDYQLSRRQMTWFRRNKSIQWLTDPSCADELITTFLNKKQ